MIGQMDVSNKGTLLDEKNYIIAVMARIQDRG